MGSALHLRDLLDMFFLFSWQVLDAFELPVNLGGKLWWTGCTGCGSMVIESYRSVYHLSLLKMTSPCKN